jgi:hypothetical protein
MTFSIRARDSRSVLHLHRQQRFRIHAPVSQRSISNYQTNSLNAANHNVGSGFRGAGTSHWKFWHISKTESRFDVSFGYFRIRETVFMSYWALRLQQLLKLLGLHRLISPTHGICATYTPKRYDCTKHARR